MGLESRLETLWNFIDEHLEVDYGYLPKSRMDDKDDSRVDVYIQEIKDDFRKMRERGELNRDSIQECIKILKDLDKI